MSLLGLLDIGVRENSESLDEESFTDPVAAPDPLLPGRRAYVVGSGDVNTEDVSEYCWSNRKAISRRLASLDARTGEKFEENEFEIEANSPVLIAESRSTFGEFLEELVRASG